MFKEMFTEAKKKPSKDEMNKVGIIFRREMNGEYGIDVGKKFKTSYNKAHDYVAIDYTGNDKDISVSFRDIGDDKFSMSIKDGKTMSTIKVIDIDTKNPSIDKSLSNAIKNMFYS